jgi:5-methylcytosine-specific restriction endonuclease McrA
VTALVCWINGCNVGEQSETGRRDWAIDHLIPIAVDYLDHPGDTLPNLAIACHKCNIWKHNKILPAAVARYESNLGHREEPGT